MDVGVFPDNQELSELSRSISSPHCGITWDSLHSHDNFECVFISTKPLLKGDKSNIKQGKVPTYPPATSPSKNGSGNMGRCLLWNKDALCDPSAICGTET